MFALCIDHGGIETRSVPHHRDSHRNRAKLAVVSLKVALQQCDHLLGIAHIVQNVISKVRLATIFLSRW